MIFSFGAKEILAPEVASRGRNTVSQDRKRLAHDAQGQRVVCARCFRFGGKKEAAGAAVAVIQAGIMGIECYFMIG
jgi:hypothetical protein